MDILEKLKYLFTGFFKSYSIVFFSKSYVLAYIIFLVSFVDYTVGICGAIAVLVSLICVYFIGYDKNKAFNGLYGFNSLLVGLGLGYYFNLSLNLFVLVIAASIITFSVTLIIEAVFYKYSLHFLSIPFLLSFWIVLLASSSFANIDFSTRGIFIYNTIYKLGGYKLFQITNFFESVVYLPYLKLYFNSVSSIFFVYSTIGGILISLGLLIYSRIAFIFSIIGFVTAIYVYRLFGIPLSEITFSYVGFNYILLAIAVGAYFVIPSRISIVATILLIFISVILTVAFTKILGVWQVHIYSLSFNIVTVSYIFLIRLRIRQTKGISLSPLYYETPEKNLYNYVNNSSRFHNKTYITMKLPFYGEWYVSQGHNGKYTHKENWSYAWDFVIVDSDGNEKKNSGTKPEDYFCFNKVILSPADGIIEDVFDGIKDNKIGEINTSDNWGNTIIIKHAEYFYSQLSHLKEGSIKVKRGDVIKSGQVIALCGNSGRSPFPHLHLQFQSKNEIGSDSLKYPIGNYIRRANKDMNFKSYSIPEEGDYITNHERNSFLFEAFNFKENQEIIVTSEKNGKEIKEKWKVYLDIYNNYYFESTCRKARAYFRNDNDIFYFLDYKGSRRSLLYYFYLSAYKLPLSFYENLIIEDSVSVYDTYSKPVLFLQDLIAPLFLFLHSGFAIKYMNINDKISTETLYLESKIYKKSFNTNYSDNDVIYNYKLSVINQKIDHLVCSYRNEIINIKCVHLS